MSTTGSTDEHGVNPDFRDMFAELCAAEARFLFKSCDRGSAAPVRSVMSNGVP